MHLKDAIKLHIFRAGKFTDMHGTEVEFSEADIQSAAAAYDPTVYEAPLVVGHPQHNSPAYGWVRSLTASAGNLYAFPEQIHADFAEAVKTKAYKNISASFWLKGAKNSPNPETLYLRHVGFLGAAAPAVKGLDPVEFAAEDDETVTVEFGDTPAEEPKEDQLETADFSAFRDSIVARVLQQIREWMIDRFSRNVADSVISGYDVDALKGDLQAEQLSNMMPADEPAFSEPTNQNDTMTAEEKAKYEAALKAAEDAKAEAAALREKEVSFTASERKNRRESVAAFVEKVRKEGKLLPKNSERLTALLNFVEGNNDETAEVVAFAENGANVTQSAADVLRGLIEDMPKIVPTEKLPDSTKEATDFADSTERANYIAKEIRRYRREAKANGEFVSFAEAQQQVVAQMP